MTVGRLGFWILLLIAVPRLARAETDGLKTARNTFEYGNFDEAGKLAESLLANRQLSDERDLVQAYKIAGLSAFYLNHSDAARRHFVALLSVDPDFSLDPFLVPPAAVAFFDGVKRDNESLLAPIRERRKAMAEQERLADEARRKLIEENLMRQLEPDRPVLVKTVEVHTYVTNFVPFGAGQFQENRPVAGGLFAATQVVGIATCIGSFAKIESLRDDNGRFASADSGTVNNLVVAKWAGLGLFGASVALGVADSLWNYTPTTSHIEALPQPPQKTAPPTNKPAPKAELHPIIIPWATADSVGAGLALRF